MCDFDTIKIGDVVKLKSGGPKMTVNAISLTNHVYCDWFSGSTHSTGGFHLKVLKKLNNSGIAGESPAEGLEPPMRYTRWI